MRKKTFLRAVALIACITIFSLSVPSTFAVDRAQKGFNLKHMIKKHVEIVYVIFPFLAQRVDTDQNTTPSNKTVEKNSITDSKARITGTLSLVRGPRRGVDKDD